MEPFEWFFIGSFLCSLAVVGTFVLIASLPFLMFLAAFALLGIVGSAIVIGIPTILISWGYVLFTQGNPIGAILIGAGILVITVYVLIMRDQYFFDNLKHELRIYRRRY